MGRLCAVRNCGKIPRQRSCHRLPFHHPDRLKLWLSFLGFDINTPEDVLRETDHRICALHFRHEDYVQSTGSRKKSPTKLYLKRDAVPTLSGPTPDEEDLGAVGGIEPFVFKGPLSSTPSKDIPSTSGLFLVLTSPKKRIQESTKPPRKSLSHSYLALPVIGEKLSLSGKDVRDGESMEAVSGPGASVDVGNLAAAKTEVETKEMEHKETRKQTHTTFSAQAGEADGASASERGCSEVKEEEDSNEEKVSTFEILEEGPDDSGDTSMDTTSEHEDMKSDIKVDTDVDTRQENVSQACRFRVSTADDLDEMMDIGTVDQVEQEAQMKEEERNRLADVGRSRSPGVSNTASVSEDGDPLQEEADVKPEVLPPTAEEDVKVAVDSLLSGSAPSSEGRAAEGRGGSSAATEVNGMKVVKLDAVHADTRPVRSPSPPLVKIKDEPADDEYDQALISSASTASVKDEPNVTKEDLRIGSVFSVTPATDTPVVNPSSVHMSCSHCKKNLMKGQTAFQRKGSPAIFCSTDCLGTSLPFKASKICHHCQKLIVRPQDVILSPDAKGAMKEFCSQNCLTSFNYKKNAVNKPQTRASQSLCSMCTRCCTSKHEVILNSAVHKLCSDACFKRFRAVNNLSMAGCANCSSYCHSQPLLLKLEGSSKTLCNMDCLLKYKEKTKLTQPCTMCRTSRLLADMINNKNTDESVNLFCSSSCVMAFKVQTVSASGARLNCDSCGKNTVPAYHLAMSDTSIRNFCTLPCVMVFQEKYKKSQANVFTKLPIGSAQIQSASPSQLERDVSKEPQKLSCSQCNCNITFKPELVQIKDKLIFVCSMACSQEFRKANSVTCLCEYCKIEKVTSDAKRINNKDCFFCSDGCKLLFRHDLTKSWGKHCQSCVYCHSVSRKLVTAQYGGSTEEFCSDECRSKYTMLFCHVAKCETCGHKGKLKQNLAMLGEVKHFCDLTCLLQFCCDKVATQGEVLKRPSDTEEATPVIANVVSLAGSPTGTSNGSKKTVEKSTGSSKNTGHVSIQTDAVRAHPPPPAPKILKNKALLCRPMVQNKGVSCKTHTVDCEAQTDDAYPKVMVVPVPVPVYVPVPMNMYTQCTPKPVGLPLPLPVPMFLPVTMDSAERIVETIQEIKEKIPSDPFEAELILMAEMVAEEDEKNEKEEGPKEKVVEKEIEQQEPPAPDDQTGNYSDDLDTEDFASFLNWEDASSDAGLTSPSQPSSQEKLNPAPEVPVAESSEPESVAQPPGPPAMDLEADVTVETLERMVRLSERSQNSPSPPPATPTRRQAPRKAREKKARSHKPAKTSKAAAASSSQRGSSKNKKAVVPDFPKLKSEYGVDAWKRWIKWRKTQPDLEKPRYGSRRMELKEDVLQCSTAELTFGLCCFISEVKRPNGEPYSPDSLFYLCLGIQQYLFENGRVENIFMDRFYNKFSAEFTCMLKGFKPSITASGYIHSRVEEEFLWDCKQLGAYSPIVLLNTLLFFCCKYFGFTTVEQHRQLSFAHVMRCTKTNQNYTKTTFLRFYPPLSLNEAESDPEVPLKRRREEESKEEILEMMENAENPLRCPVRLYEFYLSKCSESVKQRTNLFYLHPERCCVPNSPLWFSSTPLDDSTMEAMLIRILTVRELHLRPRKEGGRTGREPDDPPFTPDDEDGDSE